ALQLFAVSGIFGILILCGILYMVSFFASSNLQVETRPVTTVRKGFFREWWDSIAMCFKVPLLFVLLTALVLINIWNGALTILANTFLTQNLHMVIQQPPIYDSNNTFYGALGVAIEIAFVVGALIFSLTARRLGESRVV